MRKLVKHIAFINSEFLAIAILKYRNLACINESSVKFQKFEEFELPEKFMCNFISIYFLNHSFPMHPSTLLKY